MLLVLSIGGGGGGRSAAGRTAEVEHARESSTTSTTTAPAAVVVVVFSPEGFSECDWDGTGRAVPSPAGVGSRCFERGIDGPVTSAAVAEEGGDDAWAFATPRSTIVAARVASVETGFSPVLAGGSTEVVAYTEEKIDGRRGRRRRLVDGVVLPPSPPSPRPPSPSTARGASVTEGLGSGGGGGGGGAAVSPSLVSLLLATSSTTTTGFPSRIPVVEGGRGEASRSSSIIVLVVVVVGGGGSMVREALCHDVVDGELPGRTGPPRGVVVEDEEDEEEEEEKKSGVGGTTTTAEASAEGGQGLGEPHAAVSTGMLQRVGAVVIVEGGGDDPTIPSDVVVVGKGASVRVLAASPLFSSGDVS